MKSICKTFSQIGVTLCDESNEPKKSSIGYSDATVLSSNRAVKDFIRFVLRNSARVVELVLQTDFI